MVPYDKYVINKLLDTYESSVLSTGENIRNISIEFRFTKKSISAYFDETSQEYELIHVLMNQLENKELVTIIWKGKKKGHIIEKVRLRIENISLAYSFVKREPKHDMETALVIELERNLAQIETPVCHAFATHLISRIKMHKSVKEFVELDSPKETSHLLDIIQAIECNTEQLYVREFSIRVCGDSKSFEKMESKIASVFRRFKTGYKDMDFSEILAEYNIYRTPNYVYLKGDVTISIGDEKLHLDSLKQGIGISGDDINNIHFVSTGKIKRIITIENLTTFFRWNEKDSLIVYLGGYHNSLRRALLREIYANIPDATYFHFGDIDAGGFEIYQDLCKKTGIPFVMYHMDLKTLKKYERFGRELTMHDRKRLELMKKDVQLQDVISYMLEYDVKLEQECIECDGI